MHVHMHMHVRMRRHAARPRAARPTRIQTNPDESHPLADVDVLKELFRDAYMHAHMHTCTYTRTDVDVLKELFRDACMHAHMHIHSYVYRRGCAQGALP